jgi:hypothetical protein
MTINLFCPSDTLCQSIEPSTINATGGSVVISGDSYDWSICELTMISTLVSPTMIVTQGILQPAKDGSVSVMAHHLMEQLSVFPNPATDIINIEYQSAIKGMLSYKLWDVAGRQITGNTKELKSGLTVEKLDVSKLPSAKYLLKVSITGPNGLETTVVYKIEKK